MRRYTYIDDAARAPELDLTAEELRARFQTASLNSLRARLQGDLMTAARHQREAITVKRMHDGREA